MRDQDWRFFEKRSRTHKHAMFKQKIKATNVSEGERVFRNLAKSVFDVHLMYHPPENDMDPPTNEQLVANPLSDSVRRYVSWCFHTGNHYVPPNMLYTGFSKDIEVNASKLRKALESETHPGKGNNTFFLTGGIGMGKSTFATHLVSKNGRNWMAKRKMLALRIDMDDGEDHKVPPRSRGIYDILKPIYEGILRGYEAATLISKKQKIEIQKMFPFPILSDDDLASTSHTEILEEVIKVAYSHCYAKSGGYRALLIIDNIDFLYHAHDRARYLSELNGAENEKEKKGLEFARKERDRAHELIQYLIKTFFVSKNPSLYDMGANILIVLREDSMEHFRRGLPDRGDNDPREDRIYGILPPLEPNVRKAHVDLLNNLLKMVPQYRYAFTHASRSLVGLLDDKLDAEKRNRRVHTGKINPSLHSHLIHLSRQGMRDVIRHYGEYIWLPTQYDHHNRQEHGTKNASEMIARTLRFTNQLSPSLIAFITRNNCHFSQFDAEFPNMYLVRGDLKVKQRRSPDNESERNAQDGEWDYIDVLSYLRRPHKPTYWLKRLICEIIGRREFQVEPEDIFRIFAGAAEGLSPKGLKGFYEPHIVSLVLGSLSQVETSHFLNYEFNPDEAASGNWRIESISLSSRGEYLLGLLEGQDGEAFIDSFTYLQLIVDDYLLPLPKSIAKDFHYQENVNYRYLATDDYGQKVISVLEAKIPQVIRFLDILKVSLGCERKEFSGAFDRIEEELADSGGIPQIDSIEKQVLRDLHRIQGGLNKKREGQSPQPLFEYKTHVPPAAVRKKYRSEIRDNLEKAYGHK